MSKYFGARIYLNKPMPSFAKVVKRSVSNAALAEASQVSVAEEQIGECSVAPPPKNVLLIVEINVPSGTSVTKAARELVGSGQDCILFASTQSAIVAAQQEFDRPNVFVCDRMKVPQAIQALGGLGSVSALTSAKIAAEMQQLMQRRAEEKARKTAEAEKLKDAASRKGSGTENSTPRTPRGEEPLGEGDPFAGLPFSDPGLGSGVPQEFGNGKKSIGLEWVRIFGMLAVVPAAKKQPLGYGFGVFGKGEPAKIFSAGSPKADAEWNAASRADGCSDVNHNSQSPAGKRVR